MGNLVRIVGVLLLTLGLVFPGQVIAAEGEEAPPQPQAQVEQDTGLKELQGRIRSIDADRKELVLRYGLVLSRKFEVGFTTAVKGGDRLLGLGDLKAGDAVKVQYIDRNGRNVARAISLLGVPK